MGMTTKDQGQSQVLAGAQSGRRAHRLSACTCAKPLPAGILHPRTSGACVRQGCTFVVANNSRVLIVDDKRPIVVIREKTYTVNEHDVPVMSGHLRDDLWALTNADVPV